MVPRLIALVQGHASYVARDVGGVIVAYILLGLFIVLVLFWKWLHNETATPLDRIDLREGKTEIDIEEENYEMRRARAPPRPWYKRLLSKIE